MTTDGSRPRPGLPALVCHDHHGPRDLNYFCGFAMIGNQVKGFGRNSSNARRIITVIPADSSPPLHYSLVAVPPYSFPA